MAVSFRLQTLLLALVASMAASANNQGLDFVINRTWDGKPVDHKPINFNIKWNNESVKPTVRVTFEAPFFNDPPSPASPPGITDKLWDYEVFEVFFANDPDQYVEVEVGPHGHWIVLLLDGVRKPFNHGERLELKVENSVDGNVWKGHFDIPLGYFPGKVTKFNAYGIHGSKKNRVYEALSPVTDGSFTTPDFHRVQFFQFIAEGFGDVPYDDTEDGLFWAGHL